MSDRQAVIDALTKPFPREAIKQKQGRDYVSGTTVVYRLNAATNYGWEFEITGHEQVGGAGAQGNKPAQVVYGRMRIPAISDGWRADMGTQLLENAPDDHEAYKGAATDCLKRCARQFGVGLHLWGPDIEAGEIGNRGRVDQPRQQVAPAQRQEMVSVPDAGGGFRRVPADSPAARDVDGDHQTGRQRITDRQMSFIRQMTREKGMTDAAVDQHVQELFGKAFADMDRRDASAYIERLKSVEPLGEQSQRPMNGNGYPQHPTPQQIDQAQMMNPNDPATDKQRDFIIGLAKQLGMVSDNGHHDAAALDAEVRQLTGGETMGTITKGQAKLVIDEFMARPKLVTR